MGRYMRSMPRRNTQCCASATSCTQRSSNLPESFQVNVAGGPVLRIVRQQHAGLDEDLKSVADSQDELLGGLEGLERVLQVMPDLVGQNPPGGDVVTVAEPAGQAQHLVLIGQSRVLEQAIDVHQFRPPAGSSQRQTPFHDRSWFPEHAG